MAGASSPGASDGLRTRRVIRIVNLGATIRTPPSPPAVPVIPQQSPVNPSSRNRRNLPLKAPKTVDIPRVSPRLLRDLREIYISPLPNIHIHMSDKTSDLSKLCVVLTPPEGPYLGLRLHFKVHIPSDYPRDGPNVSICTNVQHPNVYGNWICCDILKGEVVREGGYVGGYTPAYTLQTILVQLLSFFTSTEVDQDWGGKEKVNRTQQDAINVKKFICKECGYNINFKGIIDDETVVPGKMTRSTANDTKCHLPTLDSISDAWLLIAEHLGDSDLRSLSSSYPPFADLSRQHNIAVRRDLKCFYLRTGIASSTLGVGITREDAGANRSGKLKYTFSSAFDLLSIEAFRDHEVSQSVWGEPINGFLPLVLNERHYLKAKDDIEQALMWMAGKRDGDRSLGPRVGEKVKFEPWVAVEVIAKMMNQMVVNLMKEVEEADAKPTTSRWSTAIPVPSLPKKSPVLHASEKALTGYLALLHILTTLALTNPSIPATAHQKVTAFIRTASQRAKTAIPDLGEFLVLLALVPSSVAPFADVVRTTLKECLTRQVVWTLKERPYLAFAGAGEGMEEGEIREKETFEGGKTGLRLMMFQMFFLREVIGGIGAGVDVDAYNGVDGESDVVKTTVEKAPYMQRLTPEKEKMGDMDEDNTDLILLAQLSGKLKSPPSPPTTPPPSLRIPRFQPTPETPPSTSTDTSDFTPTRNRRHHPKPQSLPYSAPLALATLSHLSRALSSNYGLPPPALSSRLATTSREILTINTFPAFFTSIGHPQPQSVPEVLRTAVRDSQGVGYHVNRYSAGEGAEMWRARVRGGGKASKEKSGGRSFFPNSGKRLVKSRVEQAVPVELNWGNMGGWSDAAVSAVWPAPCGPSCAVCHPAAR